MPWRRVYVKTQADTNIPKKGEEAMWLLFFQGDLQGCDLPFGVPSQPKEYLGP